MRVDNQLIEHLADLAKLTFSEEEKEALKKDLQQIFAFVEKIKEIDVEGVEPLVQVHDFYAEMREDIPFGALSQQEALKNAPKHDGTFFRVPKFVKR